MSYSFRTNEYLIPYSISLDNVATYILGHKFIRMGFLGLDVISGPKTLAQIWFNEYAQARFDFMDRSDIFPVKCSVNWDRGDLTVAWNGRIPDHELIASYEFENLAPAAKYTEERDLNWSKEGF